MKAWKLIALGSLVVTILGCGVLHPHPASKIIPVSEFEQIAGNWEGLSKRVPDMVDDASVMLIISEKGHFNFASDRARGLVLGTGILHIQDGIVFGKGSAGTGMFTLHDQAGKPVLVVDVALNDGNHYFLEMTRIR